jgi:hypothetical protein
MFGFAILDDEFHFLPMLALCLGRCSNERCAQTHGYRLTFAWFEWGVGDE